MTVPAKRDASTDSLRRRESPNTRSRGVSPSPLSLEPKSPSTGARDASTVLYLAYGSNLCAETFRGKRGIKPLSQVNVYVPLLEFNLRLPGFPYMEPCFANVNFRRPHMPPTAKGDESEMAPVDPWRYSDEKWDGGLMGVVYEVTYEDYRQIIRTEGGGSGYKEITIPCVPLKPGSSTVHKQSGIDLPKPIFAKTLYAPPNLPLDSESSQLPWWRRFLSGPHRPNPDHAQASARYLKLITDGARENDLPAVYQRYLASLEPYTVTTLRQQIGRILCVLVAGPIMLSMMGIAQALADKDGKYPRPIAMAMTFMFNVIWFTYDHVSKPLFGDGERTQPSKGAVRPVRRPSLLADTHIIDEEKLALLGE